MGTAGSVANPGQEKGIAPLLETEERYGDIWVALPAYNNAETVLDIATRCRKILANVLVIDDGSNDADLCDLLSDTEVELIRHPVNRGKGEALRSALKHIDERGGRFMISIDSDGQHLPEDIPLFLEALDENAIIIGARNTVIGEMPSKSRFGRSFSDFWVTLETGQPVEDTQSGFRAYPVRHMVKLPLKCRRYDFEIEVLARASWAGLEIRSIPVRVWYAPANERISSFRPFMDNLRISLTHTRLIGRRLLPWPHKRLVPRRFSTLEFLKHPSKLFKKLLGENVTPAGLAASAAVGVFLGTLPLVGFHMLAVLFVTMHLRLNKIMALTIQNICMPPVVPALCIGLGFFIRNGYFIGREPLRVLASEPGARIVEWIIGSLILAPVLAGLSALIIYMSAHHLRKRFFARGKTQTSTEASADSD